MINEEQQNEENKASESGSNSESYTPKAAAVEPETAQETASSGSFGFERPNEDLIWISRKVSQVRQEMGKFVIGQEQMVDLLMAGIFCNGHILLEGVPGVAKTLSSKVMAKALDIDFSRIQFTPDLMPSDVIGTSVFNMKDSSFTFKKGPVFSNIVLIDEINRAPAKTQAALFEVMEERQITYDGQQYKMEFPFLVVATMNPIEQEGTYSLPEAQLDRFLFKIKVYHPELDQETEILKRYKNTIKAPALDQIQAVFNASEIQKIQDLIEKLVIEDRLLHYIAAITIKTRNHAKIYLGASPRASLSMLK